MVWYLFLVYSLFLVVCSSVMLRYLFLWYSFHFFLRQTLRSIYLFCIFYFCLFLIQAILDIFLLLVYSIYLYCSCSILLLCLLLILCFFSSRLSGHYLPWLYILKKKAKLFFTPLVLRVFFRINRLKRSIYTQIRQKDIQ